MKTTGLALIFFAITAGAFAFKRANNVPPYDLKDALAESSGAAGSGSPLAELKNNPRSITEAPEPKSGQVNAAFTPATAAANEPEEFCRQKDVNGLPVVTQTKHTRYRTTYNGNRVDIHYTATTHQGDPNFYGRIYDILAKTDTIIEEGVLPSGFYGPPYLYPYYFDSKFDAQPERVRQTRLRLYSIKTALEKYKADNNRYPASLDDLRLVKGLGLYDAWGKPFVYTKDLDVISLGPDGGDESAKLGLKDGIAPPQKTIFDAEQTANDAYYDDLTRLYPRIVSQNDQALYPGTARLLVADVSVDMLAVDNIPELNKALKLRDKLPSIVLEQVLRKDGSSPLTIGIHYGCGHGNKMDQRIRQTLKDVTGEQAEVSYEWLNVWR